MSENLSEEEWEVLKISVPPELVKLGTMPSLQRFFDAMIYKLRRNAHKGKWEDLPLTSAFMSLQTEVDELASALNTNSTSEILMEAADVANVALIVAEIGLEARGV